MQSKVEIADPDTLFDVRLNGDIKKIGYCQTDESKDIFEMCFFTDDPGEQLIFHFADLDPQSKKVGDLTTVEDMSKLQISRLMARLQDAIKKSSSVDVWIKGGKRAVFIDKLPISCISFEKRPKHQGQESKLELDSYIKMMKSKSDSTIKCISWT